MSESKENPSEPAATPDATVIVDLLIRHLEMTRTKMSANAAHNRTSDEPIQELFCTIGYVGSGWHDVCPLLYYHSDS